MEGTKLTSGVRKGKKKQAKDEFDRIKQAEKKRRRLEKALATSAAIRSELEKKKQKKKEEQERLDKEGAAIAEAVALHVLLGEDSGDMICEKNHNADVIIGRQSPVPYYGFENMECVHRNGNEGYGYERVWDHWGNSNLVVSYGGEDLGAVGLSAGHIAAQAVSSLKIGSDESSRLDAYVFNNPMLRG